MKNAAPFDTRCRDTFRRLVPAGGRRSRGAALRDALGEFHRGQRGAATIGAAIAISILVTAFAALMGIVHELYVEDRMARGARAGARAVSLLATAPASEAALKDVVCRAFRRELGEEEPGEGKPDDCKDRWTVEVKAFPTPRALFDDDPRGDGSPGGENEDMVLILLSRPWHGWLSARGDAGTEEENPDLDLHAESEMDLDVGPDDDENPPGESADPVEPAAAKIVVAAVARNERAVTVPR